jgi:hypothetical protein
MTRRPRLRRSPKHTAGKCGRRSEINHAEWAVPSPDFDFTRATPPQHTVPEFDPNKSAWKPATSRRQSAEDRERAATKLLVAGRGGGVRGAEGADIDGTIMRLSFSPGPAVARFGPAMPAAVPLAVSSTENSRATSEMPSLRGATELRETPMAEPTAQPAGALLGASAD